MKQNLRISEKKKDDSLSEDTYEFEPEEDEILSNLLPKIFQLKFLKQC